MKIIARKISLFLIFLCSFAMSISASANIKDYHYLQMFRQALLKQNSKFFMRFVNQKTYYYDDLTGKSFHSHNPKEIKKALRFVLEEFKPAYIGSMTHFSQLPEYFGKKLQLIQGVYITVHDTPVNMLILYQDAKKQGIIIKKIIFNDYLLVNP